MEDPDAVREFVAAETIAGLRAGPWRTREISDRYVDTLSRRLEKAGVGARLRQLDGRTVLTVKAVGSDRAPRGALHDRLELEADANRKLDPTRWSESGARSLVVEAIGGEALRTLFTIDQRRVERDLSDESGTVVATLSVDEATVRRVGRRRGAFTTLEVEAADATDGAALLTSIARDLEASGLLQPEARSKLQIAREMVRIPATDVRPPRTPGISADDNMAEAGRKVLRLHLLRMLVAEAGVRGGTDVEPIHKMRVATRRMRAAWRVFDGAYQPNLQRRYIRELRVVARALGAVRDLDVQIERLDAYAERADARIRRTDFEPLFAEWGQQRDRAHRGLLDLLDKTGYEKFVDDYYEFVETPGAGALGEPERVGDAAAGRIWQAYERLRAHDPTLPYVDAGGIHQVRIDGKRLRYTLEFFREVLPVATGDLVADLTAQQDHLGLFNDAQVAATMTRQWLLASAENLPPDTRRAAGTYLAVSEREQVRLRRSFYRLWRRVVSQSYGRRIARTIRDVGVAAR